MSADSERAKQVSLARDEVDRSIRRLWLALYDLSGFGTSELSMEESNIWVYISSHPAVAEKLRDAVGGGDGN